MDRALAGSSLARSLTALLASGHGAALDQEQSILAGAAAVLVLRAEPGHAATSAAQVVALLLAGLSPHLPPAPALLALLGRLQEVLELSGTHLEPQCSDLLFGAASPLPRLRLHSHPAVAASLMVLYRRVGSLQYHAPVVVQRTYSHLAHSLMAAFEQLIVAASHERSAPAESRANAEATPAAARETSIGLVFDALALSSLLGQRGAAGLFEVGSVGPGVVVWLWRAAPVCLGVENSTISTVALLLLPPPPLP